MPDFPGKQEGAIRDICPPKHGDTQDSWVEARVWISRRLQSVQLSGTVCELTRKITAVFKEARGPHPSSSILQLKVYLWSSTRHSASHE